VVGKISHTLLNIPPPIERKKHNKNHHHPQPQDHLETCTFLYFTAYFKLNELSCIPTVMLAIVLLPKSVGKNTVEPDRPKAIVKIDKS
jgi:hypothetical protein